MGFLIDTNILIEIERGKIDETALSEYQKTEEAYISVITVSELLFGVERAQNPSIAARRSSFVESILLKVAILGIDETVARRHASISAFLASKGKLIGAHDLWIAATCLTHNLTIATHNVKEFERVPGLRITNDFGE